MEQSLIMIDLVSFCLSSIFKVESIVLKLKKDNMEYLD